MPYKDKAKQKEAQRKHYLENKSDYKSRNKKRKQELIRLVNEIKLSRGGCIDCGCSNPLCLDFHHLDNKDDAITTAIKNRWSDERILKEIEKCCLLCGNCHRLRHALEDADLKEFIAQTTERGRRNAKWLANYKKGKKCNRCVERRGECLDFHHVDRKEKKCNVSRMAASGYSIAVLEQEIAKCELICSNCHRMLHKGNVWECDSRAV